LPTSLIARARRSAIALAGATALLASLVPTVAAASLTITTPYPSIAVAPGSTASFDLTVTADRDGVVNLVVLGAPTGWKATIHGGGFVVQGVSVTANKPSTARLDVVIPGDTTATSGQLRVEASNGDVGKATLPITILVNADVAGDITLTTPSPTLTGSSDSPFTFDLTLANGSAEDQTVSATATGPADWTIQTKLSQANAASTVVKAGSSTTITVTATPPTGAPAGHTDLQVTATAGTKTITGKLGIDITGTYSLSLTTPNDLVSAHGAAGGGTTQQVVVKNTGTGDLTNVKMTATQPSNWKVDFDQPTIPTIPANQEVTVTATITPTGEAVTGDYKVTISAASDAVAGASAASGDLAMTFTVETSPLWLLAGFGLIVVILAALFYVFRTYGRR
jgi:uncharacterized membrane protein